MGLAALAHCRSHLLLLFCLFRTGACDGTVSVTLGPSPLVLSDGPGVYALNVECVWLVEAPGPITVVFTRFHTQADYDFLEIFDGTGDDAGLLANASGPALPEPLFANSTSVKIVFTSTGYVTFSGFELELFALAPGGTWVPTGVPTAAPTWASESGAALCFVPCSLPHERMRLPAAVRIGRFRVLCVLQPPPTALCSNATQPRSGARRTARMRGGAPRTASTTSARST